MSSGKRTLGIGFVLGLLANGTLGANCDPHSDYACATDEDCLEQGEGGRCEPSEMCTFPDEGCPSGRRWHDRAPYMTDMCWDPDGGTQTGSAGSSSSGSTSGTAGKGGSSGGGSGSGTA